MDGLSEDGGRGAGARSGGPAPFVAPLAAPGEERVRLFSAAYRMLGSAGVADEVVRAVLDGPPAAGPGSGVSGAGTAGTAGVLARGPGRPGSDGGSGAPVTAGPGGPGGEPRVPQQPGADTAADSSARLVREVFSALLHRAEVARPRREAHPGPWLPEPVLTSDGALGALRTPAERASVSMPWLVLLERLPPAERACRVLREVFGYGPAEAAPVLGLPPERCAALERRARQRLRQGEPAERTAADEAGRGPAVEELLRAVTDADAEALEALLTEDVVAWSDGGSALTPRRPVLGAAKVGRFLVRLPAMIPPEARNEVAEVNGDPALVASCEGRVVGVLVPEFGPQGLLVGVRTISDPDRLAFVSGQWARIGAAGAPEPAGRAREFRTVPDEGR